jgi:hypothetical protein
MAVEKVGMDCRDERAKEEGWIPKQGKILLRRNVCVWMAVPSLPVLVRASLQSCSVGRWGNPWQEGAMALHHKVEGWWGGGEDPKMFAGFTQKSHPIDLDIWRHSSKSEWGKVAIMQWKGIHGWKSNAKSWPASVNDTGKWFVSKFAVSHTHTGLLQILIIIMQVMFSTKSKGTEDR